MEYLEQEYRSLPIGALVPHPDNPNDGARDALSESMEVNGYYGAVIVRELDRGRDSYQILAGEHRWRELVDRGADRINAIVLEDVDDVTAIKIVLADNEVARRGGYKADVLDRVLGELDSIEGTGFDLSALEEAEKQRESDEAEDEPDKEFGRQYGVLVNCADESSQRVVYDRLVDEFGASDVRVVSI